MLLDVDGDVRVVQVAGRVQALDPLFRLGRGEPGHFDVVEQRQADKAAGGDADLGVQVGALEHRDRDQVAGAEQVVGRAVGNHRRRRDRLHLRLGFGLLLLLLQLLEVVQVGGRGELFLGAGREQHGREQEEKRQQKAGENGSAHGLHRSEKRVGKRQKSRITG